MLEKKLAAPIYEMEADSGILCDNFHLPGGGSVPGTQD